MSDKITASTEIMDAIEFLVSSKGISKDEVFEIIESSILDSAKDRYGNADNIGVSMNRQSGEVNLYRDMIVTEEEDRDPSLYISFSVAKRINPDCTIGGTVKQLLPDVTTERKIANIIKNNIFGKIKSIEKQVEYDEFKKREGEVVTGLVKRATKFGCIVSIGSKAEAIILREGMIFGETFREKEKVSASISEVRRSDNDFQIILSRTSNEFLLSLLSDVVPEIGDGLVEVKEIARNPGSRAKVAVWSSDVRIDAVGSCIGARGSRVSQVVDELKGEKVDIILWDRDVVTFARNAIVPAKPVRIEIAKDENDNDVIDVIVRTEELSLAIGKRGQNVRLASKILGFDLNIVSEEERSQKLIDKLQLTISELKTALDIDEIIAQLLISEGFVSVVKIAESEVDDLGKIQGFNDKIASELHTRAVEWHEKLCKEYYSKAETVGFDTEEIGKLPYLTKKECLVLMDKKINTMQDIADLSSDELAEVLDGSVLEKKQIVKISSIVKGIVYSS
ncbi:MAG: transcription termination factor NusA [Alphaproteobacteria bacterium]|nr:transcription termination factor NusA [Rickettsiales bacterium]